MKKLFTFMTCLLCLGLAMPALATNLDDDNKEKKEKKKKEKKKKAKKPFVWTMPALTGDKDFDDYLKLCDALNTKIVNYSEGITFYEVVEVRVIDENGEVDINYHVVDSLGNLRSSNKAFEQNMALVMAYPAIALDMTDLGLATTSATTSLPNLGLGSITYAKYLKAGPILIGKAGKEMKEIYKRARTQAKQIKALKEGRIDDLKALNAELNAGDVDAGSASIRVIEKNKTDYSSELEKITQEDNETPITNEEIPEEVV